MATTSSIDKIIRDLGHEGLTFKDFSFVQEGNYTLSDADWNYKDVPHLHHIHQLVEAIFTQVSDDHIATINIQKILGFRFPLSIFNYAVGKDRQIYYATFLFWVLVIQSSYEGLGPCRTRVTTRYCVGSNRFWMLFFPLVRWALRRNYDDLMSGDIPMRERRGQLRGWGYRFAGDSGLYSFRRTMDITVPNVIAPPAPPPASLTVELSKMLPGDGTFFWGREDHMGLRIVRTGDRVSIYPRMCPHEGAGLDGSKCAGGKIQCPWHGRSFAPLSEMQISRPEIVKTRTDRHLFSLAPGGVLEISTLAENAPLKL